MKTLIQTIADKLHECETRMNRHEREIKILKRDKQQETQRYKDLVFYNSKDEARIVLLMDLEQFILSHGTPEQIQELKSIYQTETV